MKYLFSFLVFLHGAIHLMGFAKGFNLAQIENLSADISRTGGVFWLIAFLLITASGVGYITEQSFWPYAALAGTIVSTLIIVGVWSDAKWGIIPNMIMVLVAVMGLSSCTWNRMIARETSQILSESNTAEAKIITEADINHLPDPVYKWIKASGMVGKPEITNVWVRQSALMKMKPDQKEWYQAEAEQYVTIHKPAFIWTVKLDMSPIIKIRGRDKYVDGNGQMLIRMNSLINVVNEKGPKLDEGTLQRFLGELVWYPSAALCSYIQWEAVNENVVKATMNYNGVSGSGTFTFDEQGQFVKFEALRYNGNKPDAKRYPWIITVDDYATYDGIRVPSRMKAIWHLDDGEWTWLKLVINDIRYNIEFTPNSINYDVNSISHFPNAL